MHILKGPSETAEELNEQSFGNRSEQADQSYS